MAVCENCQSTKLWRKGKALHHGVIRQRYLCECGHNSYLEPSNKPVKAEKLKKVKKRPKGKGKTWVITAAVNDVPVNWAFVKTLLNYCKLSKAKFNIAPIKYRQGLNEEGEYSWPAELHKYFVTENVKLTTGLRLLAGTRVLPAIGNPLSGFECFSKGDSLILAHGQMMMKSIAMSHVDPSAIITTTGAITFPVYTPTKQGEKASFNHSFSAIVVEEDLEIDGFHFRVLNSDEKGAFYDLDTYYDGDSHTKSTDIPAIVLGDEHIIHADSAVTGATFTNEDSIINVLRPKLIVRHDSLDFYSANHHHQKNVFTQYAKYISGKNNSAQELRDTVEYILSTTPSFAQSIIISSNHNEHFTRWLQECNPKLEPWNAVLFHEMSYLMLKGTSMGETGAVYPNSFELWARHNYNLGNTKFVNCFESFKVHDIELAFHGDRGINGSRGSAMQFSKLGTKTISGHQHSAQIFGGSYCVGHSCESKLEYNIGPSSWNKAHCIIQPNGKRQMIFIIKGKWRR